MARYIFSDIHGRLDLFEKICNFINPEDELYCLGDCGDRGPHPWATIKAVLTHPQVKVYLKGNHEDMLIKAFDEVNNQDHFGGEYSLLCYNGGSETFYGLMEELYPNDWIAKLRKLPTMAAVNNDKGDTVLLSHAGYTPGGNIPTPFDAMWDRNHFHDKWPEGFDNTVVIHGHTPIPYLQQEGIVVKRNKLSYCNGHKIDIDLGAYSSGMVALINLDTYQIHTIIDDELEKQLGLK